MNDFVNRCDKVTISPLCSVFCVTVCAILFFGCSDTRSPTESEPLERQISIILPAGVNSSANKLDYSEESPPYGKYHNMVLEIFHEHHDFKGPKISDPEYFIELIGHAVHEVLDTSVFDVSKRTFMDEYIPILIELRSYGAIDVFSGSMINTDRIGMFFVERGMLLQEEAEWLVGYIEAVLDCETASEAHIAIAKYTFLNGYPVAKSSLDAFHSITVSSLNYWSDKSKWGPDWEGLFTGICDGLSAVAGTFIGGAAGLGAGGAVGATIGGVAGGVYLGSAGSTAAEMMISCWDEMEDLDDWSSDLGDDWGSGWDGGGSGGDPDEGDA